MGFLYSLTKAVQRNIILSLIIGLGFLLRFIGTNPGYFAHGDEVMYGEAVYMLINRTLSMEVQLLGYPPLVAWIMLVAFTGVFIPAAWFATLIRHSNDIWMFLLSAFAGLLGIMFLLRKLRRWDNKRTLIIFLLFLWIILVVSGAIAISQTNLFHREVLGRNWANALYWGRYVTATFGVGVIYLTYKVAQAFFGKQGIALLAAFFTAVNYRLVLNSRIGFPDMFTTFFFLLGLWSIGILLNKQTLKRYLLTWISLAAFFLVKYQAYLFVPFFIGHTLIVNRAAGGKVGKFVKSFLSKEFVIGGGVALVLVLVSHIYHFMNWERVVDINRYESIKYGFGRNIINIFPLSYLYHVGVGEVISLMAVFGTILGLIKRGYRTQTMLLLSPLAIFCFLYLYYTVGGFFTRNFIAAIPFFLVFAALFLATALDWLWARAKNKIEKGSVLLFLAGILFFASRAHIVNSVISSKVYSQESPRLAAQKWVEDNISGDVVFGAFGGNPAPTDPQVKIENLTPPQEAFSYRELLQEGYDYVVVDFSVIQDTFLWWMTQPTKIGLVFWNKPDNLLAQNFITLATREYLWEHTEKAFLTPWQAPGYNFAIAKISPELVYGNETVVAQYNFERENPWLSLVFLEKDKDRLFFGGPGKDSLSALTIRGGGSLPGGGRWQSPPMPSRPGHGYRISGWIKNAESLEKTNRDGFLRLDFYQEQPKETVTSRPIVSFVSERMHGVSAWHEANVQARAPKNAQFFTIGFQVDHVGQTLYLDNVQVFETEESLKEKEGPHLTIPDEDFFLPNNNGFL